MQQVYWQISKSILECNKYILENEVDCDISFKVGQDQEVVKAHKFILRMRSPVFERMFNGSFCESETDPIISDVSRAEFMTLLRYCYYESLDIEGEIALSVLYAATKYMLPILERAARKTLIEMLNSSNIWDLSKYSTEVGDEELQAGCRTFLKGNLSSSNILDSIKFAVSIKDKELYDYYMANLPGYLSGSNIWDIYEYAHSEGYEEVHQHCIKHFQKDIEIVREALHSEVFCNIPYELLSDMLHINDQCDQANGANYETDNPIGISISEIELFVACNAWAEAECLRQEIDPTGANKRTVLGECLSLIRFQTMLPKDLTRVVYPTDILTKAEIINLSQDIHENPGAQCQVDFPSSSRQFMVTTPDSCVHFSEESSVLIELDVRVMLSRVWTYMSGSYRVTVLDENSQRSWSKVLDTTHENYLSKYDDILHYIDIEPPLVLPNTSYTVTTERTKHGRLIPKQPGMKYNTIKGNYSPYKEVKITQDINTDKNIIGFTLSLV